MRIVKLFGLVLIALLIAATPCFSAGTIIGTYAKLGVRQGSPPMVIITLTCTADAAAASWPATVVNSLTNVSDLTLTGLKLYSVKIIPGATGPTNNSDLTITDADGIDLLGGKGTDVVDNATKSWIPVGPSNYALPALITGNITVNLTNNLVDSAVVTLILELVGD